VRLGRQQTDSRTNEADPAKEHVHCSMPRIEMMRLQPKHDNGSTENDRDHAPDHL
jgi:hypothetical protein